MRGSGSGRKRPSCSGTRNGSSSVGLVQLVRQAEAHRLRRGDHRHQRGHQVHPLAVHHHAEMQLQPVDAGAFLQRGGQVAVRLGEADREVVGDLDRPAFRAQRRQVVQQHAQPGGAVLVARQHQVVGPGIGVPARRHPADAARTRSRPGAASAAPPRRAGAPGDTACRRAPSWCGARSAPTTNGP